MEAIKDAYRDYLKTPEGNRDLRLAVQMKKKFSMIDKKEMAFLTTEGVKLEKIDPSIADKIVKITIEPIALNNFCFINSKWFKKHGYTYQLGYNVFGCKCGKMTSFELHAVNKKDGVYHDFTRDYNGETTKLFYPIPCNMDERHYIDIFGDKQQIQINQGCRCVIPLKKGEEGYENIQMFRSFEPFKKQIAMLEKIVIWNL